MSEVKVTEVTRTPHVPNPTRQLIRSFGYSCYASFDGGYGKPMRRHRHRIESRGAKAQFLVAGILTGALIVIVYKALTAVFGLSGAGMPETIMPGVFSGFIGIGSGFYLSLLVCRPFIADLFDGAGWRLEVVQGSRERAVDLAERLSKATGRDIEVIINS